MSELATSQTGGGLAASDASTGLTPPINPARQGAFLSDVIVELGFASPEAIEQAEQAGRQTGQSIEQFLLENGILDEDKLSRAVAERNGLDHVDLDRFEVDMGVARMIHRSAAERYCAVPIATAADGALLVAVKDPVDSLGMSDIEVMTKSEVRRVIAPASAIERLIQELPFAPPIKWSPPAEDGEEDEVGSAHVEGDAGPTPETKPPETESQLEPAPESAPPAPESAPPAPEPRPELPEPEAQLEPSPPPEPAAVEPQPAFEPAPEVADSEPVPEPVPNGSLGDLGVELQALQETVRRADDLAGAVSRRIEELEGAGDRAELADERAQQAEDRAQQAEERAKEAEDRAQLAEDGLGQAEERSLLLERELVATQERVTELQQRLSSVDSAVEDVRDATEKLGAVRKALEASVQPSA
jgi:hypothetical protein